MRITRVRAMVALAALLALPGRPAAADAPDYRVVDAGGREVGPLVDILSGTGRVILEAGGRLAAVEVRRDRLGGEATLVYTEADCAGPPLVLNFVELFAPTLVSLMRPTAVVGGTLLIATSETPTPTDVKSMLFPGFDSECEPADETLPAYPVAPLLPVGQFQAPFRIDVAPAEPAGRHPRRALVVRENSGALLGPIIGGDLPSQAAVLRPASPAVLPVVVARSRLVESVFDVVYEGADCTGPPLLRLEDESSTPLFAGGGVTGAGDLVVAEGARTERVVQSLAALFFGVACQNFPPESAPVRPAGPLLAAADLSTPFRVSLEPVSGLTAGRLGAGQLTVVDASGQMVGRAFARNNQRVVVLLRAGRRVVEVSVTGDFIGGTRQAYFELPSCAGPALIRLDSLTEPAPLVPQTVSGPGRLLHVGDGPVAEVPVLSRWDVVAGDCVEEPLGPTPVQETSPLLDPAGFRPPFQVR